MKEKKTIKTSELYNQAVQAMDEKKYDLVVFRLKNFVIENPKNLEARNLLRLAQINISMRKQSKKNLVALIMEKLTTTKSEKDFKNGNFLSALNEAEKSLDKNPLSQKHNKNLWAAADALAELAKAENDNEAKETFQKIALFALETAALNKQNKKAAHDLGDYLMKLKLFNKAQEIFNKIVANNPDDYEAKKLEKEACARASMESSSLENTTFNNLVYRSMHSK